MSMLPGFRFLFTAIVLSMSILVFGLGAPALLRAAHEEFANLSSRRVTPEPRSARLDDGPPPTLALLRLDPPVAEKPAEGPADAVPAATHDSPPPAGQTPDAPSGRARETGSVRRQSLSRLRRQSRKPRRRRQARRHRPLQRRSRGRAVGKAEVKLAAIPDTPEPVAATPPPPGPARYLSVRRQCRRGPDRDARRPHRRWSMKDGGRAD